MPCATAATQTSFVTQVRKGMPLDIGLVYWVCLASPRTSFYLPFHFGISDFPPGFRAESERPTRVLYEQKVHASLAANRKEAFWMFSSFRDEVERRGPALVAAVQAEAHRLEQEAVARQKPDRRGRMPGLSNRKARRLALSGGLLVGDGHVLHGRHGQVVIAKEVS